MINPSASHFGLPDFRGRAPFGLDNMGGISANRITDLGADILGNSGGRETTNVEKKHIPQHEHDLRSSGVNAKQFYAIRDADSDPLTDSPEVTPLGIETGVQAVTGIPTSGTVTDGGETGNNDYRTVGGEDLGSPLSVMNPYVAVNYIIWAGT
jgi:microcystin-dependent protein